MKMILIGAGQRGRIYSDYMHSSGICEISAVAEPHIGRRDAAANAFSIPPENCFETAQQLFAKGKIADGVIIASMDLDHYEQVMTAISLGYHILLEKPVSPNAEECVKIAAAAEKAGVQIVVCHVLRYTPFFSAIKQVIDSGRLGKIITIQHNENVGNFHIAHSFVRGNWRNSEHSSPIIMQKSCHDMDILLWLVNSNAKRIASFGDLRFFNKSNAPDGSADYCHECTVKEKCRFDAEKAYLPSLGAWPATVVTPNQTEKGLLNALKTSQYGRCVYKCDNNVCDSQATLIEFENGVTVNFTLSGFTNKMNRTLKIMCEHGEIRAVDDENHIEIIPFVSNQYDEARQEVIITQAASSGHGGGDKGIVDDFIALIQGNGKDSRSSISRSVESHIMACAAEKSRLSGEVININEFKKQLSDK